jgi:hypothetical protein
MPVDRKYERDIDLLLAEEFAVSHAFAAWFLEQTTKFSSVQAKVSKVCVSKTDSTGESDIVVVFEPAEGGSSFALQIEDKINAPLQPGQEKRYRLRADLEVARGVYSDYEVILCSPEGYRSTHDHVEDFDSFVTYEKIAEFLKSNDPNNLRSIYRSDLILTASKPSGHTWEPTPDKVTSKFWNAAFDVATKEFPDLEMKPPRPTKGQTWMYFRPLGMPGQPGLTYIMLKGGRGFAELTFNARLARLLAPLVVPLLQDGMAVLQTGKSAVIRIVVDGFEVAEPDEAVMATVRAAFAACVKLIRFYRQNREALDTAAYASLPDLVTRF